MIRETTKIIMSRKEAVEALSFPCLLDNALRQGWLKPVGYTGSVKAGSAIYAGSDIEAVALRIKGGDIPVNPRVKGVKP